MDIDLEGDVDQQIEDLKCAIYQTTTTNTNQLKQNDYNLNYEKKLK